MGVRIDGSSGGPVQDSTQRLVTRLQELYTWGDITREQYQTQRTALEQELVRLAAVQEPDGR